MHSIAGKRGRGVLRLLIALLAWSSPSWAALQVRDDAAGVVKDGSRDRALAQQKTYQARMFELARQGKSSQAIDAANRFMELERELAGENTPGMAMALRHIADVAFKINDYPTATKHLRKAVEVERKIHGEGHWHITDVQAEVEYVEAVSKLGWEEREQLVAVASVRSLEEIRHALLVLRHTVGERTPRYARALEQLVWALRSQGNPFAAAIWADRCVAARAQVEGRRHPNHVRALLLRGVLHHDLEENDLALRVLEEASAIARTIPDLDSRETYYIQQSLGAVRSALGDLAGAGRAYEEAARLALEFGPAGGPEHVRALADQADVARRRREFAVARSQWGRVAAYLKPKGGAVTEEYVLALTQAARTLLDSGDHDGAVRLAREARALRKQKPGLSVGDTTRQIERILDLIGAGERKARYRQIQDLTREVDRLCRQGKFDEAVPVVETQIQGVREAIDGGVSDLVVYSLERLARVQIDRGDFAAARQARERRGNILNLRLADDHWQTVDARLALGQVDRLEHLGPDKRARLKQVEGFRDMALQFAFMGLFDAASDELRHAHALQAELMGEDDPDALDLLGDLGTCLSLAGRDVEPVALELLALNRRVRGPRHPASVSSALLVASARKARGDLRGAREAVALAGEIKRPPADKGRTIYLRYHANGRLASIQADREAREAVSRLGEGHERERDIAAIGALAEAERAVLGASDTARLESLECLARRLTARHHVDEVIAVRREIVAFFFERSGPDHWQTVDARSNLAEAERTAVIARQDPDLLSAATHADRQVFSASFSGPSSSRNQRDTMGYSLSALILWRKILGERAPRCIRDLEKIGNSLGEQGQLDASERVLKRATELWRDAVGEHHPAYAQAVQELGKVLLDQGRAAEAEQFLRRSVSLLEAQIGKFHPATAVAKVDWGRSLRVLGDLDAASRTCEDAVAILQSTVGVRHASCLMAVVERAATLQLRGDYPRALSDLEKVQQILGPVSGTGNRLATTCATNLAGLLGKTGEYARAKVSLENLLAEQRFGALNAIARFRPDDRGNDIGEGKSHPIYAERLHTLAELVMELGDSARAERLYGEALELTEELLGPDHPAMAERRVGLARALIARGELASAEKLLDSAERDLKTRGDHDLLRPAWLSTRAKARVAANRPAEAVPLLERALSITAAVLGENHAEYARRLNESAALLLSLGDLAAAQKYAERGLTLNQIRPWSDGVTEAALLVTLARVRARRADLAGARDLYGKALKIREGHIARNLPALGERERLNLVARFREPFLESLELSKNVAALDGEAFGRLVFWNGIATAAARRESQSFRSSERVFLTYPHPTARELLVKNTYARLVASASAGSAAVPAQVEDRPMNWIERDRERARTHDLAAGTIAAIIERIGEIEAQAGHLGVEPKAPPGTEQVIAAIPPRAVLLEFIRYAPPGGEPRYAAFVARRGKPPQRVELGPAGPIDRGVGAWLAAIEADSDDWDIAGGLYRMCWAPLASLCRDAETVLIAPDGELNRLPWGALPDLEPGARENAFLLERHTFAQVTSARQLVERPKPATGQRGLLTVGGVDFDRSERVPNIFEPLLMAAQNARSPQAEVPAGPAAIKVAPLRGTAEESRDVAELFEATFGRPGVTIALSGPLAEKTHVKAAMVGVRYILLATHGFFDPPEIRAAFEFEDKRPAVRAPAAVSRADATTLYPGLLSGLMLAGVNNPAPLIYPAGYVDWGAGLLTAEEVSELNLSGCELAVLSACQTGVGQVAGGEGALGLQRAFHVAGARFVVASLWRVSDRTTRHLMSLFFKNVWAHRLSPPEAMRRAQLSVLREDRPPDEVRGPGRLVPSKARDAGRPSPHRRHPRLWAAWVTSGVPDEPQEPTTAGNPPSAPQAVPARRRSDRASQSNPAQAIPPGWFGGKLEPFLAVTVARETGDVFTTSSDGLLRHYDYPEFNRRGQFKLTGPASHVATDSGRGLLFALVTRPGALTVDKSPGKSPGAGEFHAYDIKPILDGRLANGSNLKPAVVVPLGANVSWMRASKNGLRLYCLKKEAKAGSAASLIRIDTTANRVDAACELPAGTDVVCMARDESAIFAAVATRRATVPNGSEHGEGSLMEIDPEVLKLRRTVAIPVNPLDIQSNERGLVFVSGGSERRSDGIIAVVEMQEKRTVISRWPLVSHGTRICLSHDSRWLFLSPNLVPPHIEAWLIRQNPSDPPTVKQSLRDPTGIPLGGDLFLTPLDDYLLTRPGGIVPIRVAGNRR